MSHVFVLDTHKQPLNPVHPGYARLLLTQGKAAVFKRYPFTIILKTAVGIRCWSHYGSRSIPAVKPPGWRWSMTPLVQWSLPLN